MRDFSITGLFAAAALAVAAGFNGCSSDSRDSSPRGSIASPQAATCLVTFYSGGVEIGHWESDRYTSGDGKLYFYQSGNSEPYVLSGTYVLEPKPPAAPDPDAEADLQARARHKVSLYSDGVLVRTFYVQRYSSGDGKLYLYPEVGRPATVLGGTFVVEPVSGQGTGDTPRFTVSLYSGSRVVRSWNVTRYTSGSGKMYLYVPGYREPIVVSGSFIVEPK